MTRYDPFSYGQVPLNPKEQAAAAPDDMLFAAPAATSARAAPAADSDWDPPGGATFREAPAAGAADDTLAFGQDILGESVPATAPAPAAARATKAATPAKAAPAKAAPRGEPAAASPRPRAAAPAQAPLPVAAASVAPAEPPSGKPAVRRGPMPVPMVANGTTAGLAIGVALVATGAATASWFVIKMDNPVMGAIAGAVGVVGGALAWLLLRR